LEMTRERSEALTNSWTPSYKIGTTGESYEDVQKRMKECIHQISTENPGKKILVISHGTALRTYMIGIMGLALDGIGTTPYLDNCSISQLRPFAKHARNRNLTGLIIRYNDAGHIQSKKSN